MGFIKIRENLAELEKTMEVRRALKREAKMLEIANGAVKPEKKETSGFGRRDVEERRRERDRDAHRRRSRSRSRERRHHRDRSRDRDRDRERHRRRRSGSRERDRHRHKHGHRHRSRSRDRRWVLEVVSGLRLFFSLYFSFLHYLKLLNEEYHLQAVAVQVQLTKIKERAC